MNVCCLGFAFERALEHLLRGDVFTLVKLYDAPVIERICVSRQRAFCPQTRLGDVKIGARPCCHLGNALVLLYKGAKLQTRFTKTAAGKLLMSALESA